MKNVAVLTNSERDFNVFAYNNMKPGIKYKLIRRPDDCSGAIFEDWIKLWDWHKIQDPDETFHVVQMRIK